MQMIHIFPALIVPTKDERGKVLNQVENLTNEMARVLARVKELN